MTTLIRRFAAASVVLAWFFLPSIGHAQSCTTSLASLHGWYAMLITGTNAAGDTNEYFTGAVLFDGQGNLSGTNIYSGTGTDSPVTGTYILNTDCSLTLTMTIGSGAAQEFTVGVRSSTNEAVGIEVDTIGIATIDLQAQYATYTPGLNFTSSSANGTFAASCINFLANESDLNLATFANGTIAGTLAYNNGDGVLGLANVSYSGTYTVNSDGTIVGSVSIAGDLGTYGFYGVLSNTNSEIEYVYTTTSASVTSPYAACTGSLAPVTTPSFTLQAAAPGVSVAPGANGTDGISVTPTNGFTGSVSFAASGLPSGATAAFSPATSATGTTLTLTTTSSTPTGSYPITITGTSGSLVVTTSLTLTVTSPSGFSLSPAAPAVSVTQGANGTDGISVTATNGFTGSVSFAASGLPSGATAAFSPATSATGTTLTFTTTSNTPTGSYQITITGTSGSLVVTTGVTLTVTAPAGFSLTAASPTLTLPQNTGGTDGITVTPVNGFTGSVSLAATGLPSGASSAFSGNTLIVFVTATAATGSYSLTITGTSGSTTASTTVTLVITAGATFTLSPSAASVNVTPGNSVSDAISVIGSNGFTSAVSFSASGLPTGVTAAFSPASSSSGTTLSLTTAATTTAGSYTITITGTTSGSATSNPIKQTVPVTLVVGSPPSFTLSASAGTLTLPQNTGGTDGITVTPVNGFTGSVSLAATGFPSGASGTFSGNTLTVLVTATAATGSYSLTITGTSGSTTASTTVTLVITAGATFTLSPSAPSVNVTAGNSVSDAISVVGSNGFNSAVSFSASGLPTGVTAAFSPASSSSGTTLSLTTAATTTAGSYTITITGTTSGSATSNPIKQTIPVTLVVGSSPSFTLSAAAGTLTLQQNMGGTDGITVTPVNGFTGSVSLAATGLPSGTSSVFSGNTLIVFVTATAATGSYSLTITGTSGSTTASTTVTLVITAGATFTLSPSAPSVSVTAGNSVSDAISVVGSNGFNSAVSFSASGLPTGVTAAFSPASSSSGTTLSLTTAATTTAGSYTITITGTTSGSGTSNPIKQTIPVTLVVGSSPSFTLSASAGTLTLPQNTGGTDGITVTPVNGFTGSVSLAATGFPSGASGTFSGNTLFVFVTATAATGSYSLTITGTSGSTTASTTVTLVITAGATFTLSPSAPSVSVTAGNSVSDAISVVGSNGFNSAVSFSASGLPTGVTAAFSPASSSSGTTLSLTTAATTTAGSYTITITGTTSGSGTSNPIKQTTTVTLVITAGGKFSLSPAAAKLVLLPLGHDTDVITVAGANGFSGTVTFKVTGLPTGVTGTFSPTSSTSKTTLTIAAPLFISPGTYTVTITGTSAGSGGSNALTATTTISLQVL